MTNLDNTFYFVDIESTGIDLKNDRIIQLALLKAKHDEITAFNDLCYTDIEMNDTVIAIHHITNAMLEDKYWPYETDAFLELEKGNVEGNFFVSHGNELDVAMLENEELELKMSCIDTDKCSRILLKDASGFTLSDLMKQYGLDGQAEKVAKEIGLTDLEAHDALTDAIWHYVLFKFLMTRVENSAEKLVELTSTPMMLEKVSFGKHKNKTFEEVMIKDPQDMVWMYVNVAKNWLDLDHTLTHWLKTKEYFWKMAQEKRNESSWFD